MSGAVGPTPAGIFIGCLFLVLIALTANSTHAIVGTAAPMDIGGRKMAGFASGVIDSFQYYGTALALAADRLADRSLWLGRVVSDHGELRRDRRIARCCAVMRKQKRMLAAAHPRADIRAHDARAASIAR